MHAELKAEEHHDAWLRAKAELDAEQEHWMRVKAELEAEMAGFDPDEKAPSPNRMDALVWAVTELMGGKTGVLDYYRMLDERDAAEEAKRK